MTETITAAAELDAQQTVQPSVEDIERCLNAEFGPFLAHAPYDPARFWRQSAHAVLALLPGRPEREVLAQGWDEGHRHRWRRGPDDCFCGAWSSIECACGKYGTGELLSLKDNPYRKSEPDHG